MPLIAVKTAPGRVAYTAPTGGREIPSDRFSDVEHTAWIDRLIHVHGDLIRKPDAKPEAEAPAKNVATATKGS